MPDEHYFAGALASELILKTIRPKQKTPSLH
jgi:hypothetical protein